MASAYNRGIAVGSNMSMSLEKKLPLMMTAVLVIILGVGVSLAYREVSMSAEQAAVQRIKQVSNQLAGLVGAGQPRTEKQLAALVSSAAIRRILRERRPTPGDIATATRELTAALTPGDSGVGLAVVSTDGGLIASARSADIGQRWIEGVDEDLALPATVAISTSPFYLADGRVFYSTIAPVIENGYRLGSITQHRRLNAQPSTERDLVGLTGQNAKILFKNSNGSLWSTLGGKPVPPPSNPQTIYGMQSYDHAGTGVKGRVLVSESPVRGMPWVVAFELPLSTLSAAPKAILRQFLIVSALLLLVGALAMWIIGRRVTTPLANLTRAAEAIASGDYSQRVETTGDREIAGLAETFNRMAKGTSSAHRELEDRFREARSLAEELEHANRRLRATTDAAQEAQMAAETANAAKSSFLAAMSHELRTPLNAIAGYVQLIQLGLRGPVTDEQQVDLERIKKSQAYLLGLIEDVLNFAKLDAHEMEFHNRDVPLDEIMRDVETLLAPQMKASGIEYSHRECNPDITVRADPDKTQQILVNLLANAVKFTNSPGRITVSCSVIESLVRVRVTDTGIGIRDNDKARVFEPFVQLGRGLSQPRDGVGLGLSISRDFATRMGGDLSVESVPGEGSTFTLTLPRASEAHSDRAEPRPTEAVGTL